jgi:peptide/nickel transport system substrate-binding protein
VVLLTLIASACATATPSAPGAAAPGAQPAVPAAPKAFVMAISAEPATLGPFQVGGTGHQGPVYQILHDFLVVHGDQGQAIAHLAAERPSQDKGTWLVAPDGTMETTWRLRQGVKWHDGTEFTARDAVFGWRIANDSAVPWSRPALARLITEISTPDDYTLVMRWKSTFPFADNPEESTLDPLPVHILDQTYRTDVQAFVNSPYWTREFVGLGPYRLTTWEPGSHLEMQAVDDHYKGRPRIGRITVRFVTDANTMMANFLSGAVDVNVPSSNLTEMHWQTLREQWRDGEVIHNIDGTFSFVAPNQRVAPFGDVRIRRALAHAVDRSAVVDAQLVPRSLIADGMVLPGSDRARQFKERIVVYDYEPARAMAFLEETGWRRGGDGVARNAEGQPLEFEFRSSRATEAQVIADLWKTVGLTANIVVPAANLTTDLEYQATVRGIESAGFGLGFGMWERRMHSSAIPTPQTRYAGTNRRYYSNPQLDALIDRFVTTLNESERDRIEGDMLEIVSRDAVLVPLFVASRASVVRKGITGIKPMAGSPIIVANYYNTWNILEWDRT